MNNGDYIRSMSNEELLEFISQISYGRECPWEKPFEKEICKKCPTITATIVGESKPRKFTECDFADGVCPHGTGLEWWLKQERNECGNRN